MTFARERLGTAIAALPETAKLYATLAFYEGLSDAEIADALNVSDGELETTRESTVAALGDAVPVTSREVGRLKRAILARLSARFVEVTGQQLDAKQRAWSPRAAIVPTVPDAELDESLRDVSKGDGGELRVPKYGGQPSFHSAYSSCALAINSFGPWRLRPTGLKLCGEERFESLQLEVKFPIDPHWRTAPNLDVLVEAGDHVIAIESKLTEYLASKHTAMFRDAYDGAVERLAHQTWREQYERLRASPDEFAFFNAAQVVKHYLGLKADRGSRIAGRRVMLLLPRSPVPR